MTRAAIAVLALLGVVVAVSAREPQRPRITGVSHAAFYVHDMYAARVFYLDLLGLSTYMKHWVGDNPPDWGLIRINDRQFIELRREREAGGDRLAHIALETNDAEAMRLYLKSRGVAVPDAVTRGTGLADTSVVVSDPDAHEVEFVQDGWMGNLRRDPEWKASARTVSADMRHVGILVGHLDSALGFYRDILGFKETWRGSRDEKELHWVNMQVPDGQDYIEFMLYRDVPEPSTRGSQHHICLFVPDIGKALATLQPRAAQVGYAAAMEPRVGVNRRRQLNLFDPDGTRTELMEPATIDGVPAPSSQAPPPRRESDDLPAEPGV
jgi:lactoylglutathione lyase